MKKPDLRGEHVPECNDDCAGDEHAMLPDDVPAPRRPNLILVGLNRLPAKHVYAGTVPPHVKAARRAKGKAAKAARKANRGRR